VIEKKINYTMPEQIARTQNITFNMLNPDLQELDCYPRGIISLTAFIEYWIWSYFSEEIPYSFGRNDIEDDEGFYFFIWNSSKIIREHILPKIRNNTIVWENNGEGNEVCKFRVQITSPPEGNPGSSIIANDDEWYDLEIPRIFGGAEIDNPTDILDY